MEIMGNIGTKKSLTGIPVFAVLVYFEYYFLKVKKAEAAEARDLTERTIRGAFAEQEGLVPLQPSFCSLFVNLDV